MHLHSFIRKPKLQSVCIEHNLILTSSNSIECWIRVLEVKGNGRGAPGVGGGALGGKELEVWREGL